MNPVDQLGQIKAQIAELQVQEDALKALIIDTGEAAVEGALYRATVSITEKTSTDWKSVAQRLKPSRQLVAAHTHTAAPYVVVRVTARKTS